MPAHRSSRRSSISEAVSDLVDALRRALLDTVALLRDSLRKNQFWTWNRSCCMLSLSAFLTFANSIVLSSAQEFSIYLRLALTTTTFVDAALLG